MDSAQGIWVLAWLLGLPARDLEVNSTQAGNFAGVTSALVSLLQKTYCASSGCI